MKHAFLRNYTPLKGRYKGSNPNKLNVEKHPDGG
jgi:hypothetical protein